MSDKVYLRHPSSLDHDTGGHPERAARVEAIEHRLAEDDWLGWRVEQAPPATREQLERVHPAAHVDAIESISGRGGGMLDVDTVASAGSYEAATHAAGAAVRMVDLLSTDEVASVFCGARPPGHHAEVARAMGFCLFNNVAVAAAHARAARDIDRVAILDWDVHHGNGTNDIFYASDAVLYISLHQSPLYPGTGALTDSGSGAGEGYTINLPVPPGSGDALYMALVSLIVLPILREYLPDLLLVSAGYDAHRDDPLADCMLDDASYGQLASLLAGAGTELGAPLGFTLEGGYDLRALSESVARTLTGVDAPQDADGQAAVDDPTVAAARRHYARWWPSLN